MRDQEFDVPCGVNPLLNCKPDCKRYPARKNAVIQAAQIKNTTPANFVNRIREGFEGLSPQDQSLWQIGESATELNLCARKDEFGFAIIEVKKQK